MDHDAEQKPKNEMAGTGFLRHEISDKAQERRNRLRAALSKAGVSFSSIGGALNLPGGQSGSSATAQAAARHVARGKQSDRSHSNDSGAYLSL